MNPDAMRLLRRRLFIISFLLGLTSSWVSAQEAATFRKLENCRLVANPSNDGDSFHVRAAGKEYIFRLYFVDCPETDPELPERVADQAAYFSIPSGRALEAGGKARAFTARLLSKPFTVHTRWKDAGGRSRLPRYFAFVHTADGRDLSLALVRNGLARIYGARTTLPDGSSSRIYLGNLKSQEAAARRETLGGWKQPR